MHQAYTTQHPIPPNRRRQLQRYALLLVLLLPGLVLTSPAAGRRLGASHQPAGELPVTFTRVGALPLILSNETEIVGARAYLDDTRGAIHVVDIGQPATRRLLATYQSEGRKYRLQQVVGATAYLAYVDNTVSPPAYGLEIVDLANPQVPRVLSSSPIVALGTSVGIRDLVVVGDKAYGVDGRYFYTLDVADPAHIRVVGSTGLDLSAGSLAVEGKLAYVAGGNLGDGALQVVDVADPAMPKRGEVYTIGRSPVKAVAVVGGIVYLGTDSFPGGRVMIIDTRDLPPEQQVAGLFFTDNAVISLCVIGNLVYVGTAYSEFSETAGRLMLLVFEAPGTLKLLGEYTNVGEVSDIEVVGPFVYITAGRDFQILRTAFPSTVLVPMVLH